MSVSGNANVGNLGTAGLITATGNITGGNLFFGSGQVSGTGNITAGNVLFGSGQVSGTGSITAATFTGNVSGNVAAAYVTVTGAYSGNSNASTLTGSLGLRTIASTYTDNVAAASATLANAAVHGIGTPTLAASNLSVTATNAATFFIQGAPTAGTNMTITNPYALFVAAGNAYFAANVTVGNILGNGQALTGINASNIASGTLAQARLANSSLTVNGTAISLGGSATITSNTTQSLSNGSYITGGSFNGGTAITWAVDATTAATASKVVARDANANIYANNAIFTAVTGDGSGLTTLNASNISSGTLAQARLANSSLTVNGTAISLGGSGTITANSSVNLTFNNGGAGDASGTTFNGGTAKTISYNTIGAPSTTGTNASGTWGISITGSAATAGTVTTAAQPNITSLGTLTGLNVNGTTTGVTITANGNLNTSNTSMYSSANGAAIFSTSGTAIVSAAQQGGRLYEAHDYNSYPALYSTSFINNSTSSNVPSGVSGMGYRFIMGAGDTTTRGFDLLGTSQTNGSLWFRERSIGTWNQVVYNSGSWSINVTGSAGSVTNAVTFNNGGSGAASGTTYDGSAARTISYNTVGAPSTTGTNASGTWGISITGSAASATTAGTVTTAAQGNITSVGTLTSLSVSGTATVGAVSTTTLTTGANTTAGTITGNWSLSAGSKMQATYADLAEYYKPDTNVEAGDVVVLGGEFDVTTTELEHDHRVAGIVSTDPAYLMNAKSDDSSYVAIALTGRVPCKVIGPINKGDLLVTSSTKGYAQKLDNSKWIPGCVIGKSLENVGEGQHTIEVAVGRY